MLDGLVEHLEAHLGEVVGTWDTDPEGNELPFQIVHYGGSAPAGTEVFSTLGLSDYELGEHGDRIELLMIAPLGLTAGTIPPILLHAGSLPIDADEVPELGDTYVAVEELGEVSPMDALYVGRPLYQPAGFNPFDGDDRPRRVLVADPDLRRRGGVRRSRGLGGVRAADVGPRRRSHRLHPRPVARRLTGRAVSVPNRGGCGVAG